MNALSLRAGHRNGGLFCCTLLGIVFLPLAILPAAGQTQDTSGASQPAQPPVSTLSRHEIAELTTKAEAGDASAQFQLGQAYRGGNGVPQNVEVAYKWIRKAADQGNAAAQNLVGTMYRLGEGVRRDKEEAVRWYQKAARQGSGDAMFNLGTCYYNGDGVDSSEYTAFAWFLIAQEAGSPFAGEAVKRSAATMRKRETAEIFVQIGDLYDKGEEIPRDESRAVAWLRKAAADSPQGKVRLAVQLVKGPDGKSHYAEAMELCKAAGGDYAPAQRARGYFYRTGIGVARNPGEAVKWYKKAAQRNDGLALVELAEMYEAGEGTKVDRPEAFIAYFRAGRLGVKGASRKALSLWKQMGKEDQGRTAKKLRTQFLDPDKVITALEAQPSS